MLPGFVFYEYSSGFIHGGNYDNVNVFAHLAGENLAILRFQNEPAGMGEI